MKKLQNNFTTPEQSRRLLELGLPADSADCYYNTAKGEEDYITPYIQNPKIYPMNFECYDAFPGWSVGRLMEILTMCHLWKEGRFVFKENMCESLVSAIEDFTMYGEMDFSKLEE